MRILLVEDQTMIRQQLRRFIQEAFPQAHLTEAQSVAELWSLSADHSVFDLAIVDLELKDGNALMWIEKVSHREDTPKILILSAEHHEYVVAKAVRANVSGFVHKNDDQEILIKALKSVMEGGFYYSPTVQAMRSKMHLSPEFFMKILSDREQQVLQLVTQGFPDEDIAPLLTLQISSVSGHRKNIMRKLDLHTREQLVAYGKTKGFDRVTI